jgi:aminoglycoside 3-N-acetyltransferase I
MIVRRLEAGDETVAREAVVRFKHAYPNVDHLRRFLVNEDHYFYVAEVDGELAGFLLAYKMQRCDGARAMMFLYEIEVLSRHRRQGIGRALVEAVKAECERQGVLKMFVFTEESNEPAQRLYLSSGGRLEQKGALLFHF